MDHTWQNDPRLKAHLEHVLAFSPDALGVARAGVHVFVNPAYAALFGFASAEELLGTPIVGLIAERDRERVAEYVRRRIAGDPPVSYETIGLRKDGSEFPMEVHVGGYTLGDVHYTNVVLRDLTERQAAEVALRESEEKFRVISEQTFMGIMLIQDDSYLYVNRAAAELMSSSVEEVLSWQGLNLERLVHPDHLAFVREQGTKKQRGDRDVVSTYTYRLADRDGQPVWGELYSRTVLYRGRPADLVTLVDITQRTLAAEKHEQLEAALRQAQKMEAIGRLAGGVAHDFNNLLTGILGNVDLALHDLGAADPLRAMLDDARTAALQAAQLTSGLLAFSRKQAIQPRVVDLNDIVRGTERMLGRMLSASIARKTSLQAGALAVKVDPAQLEQVIINLVLNARDAMPEGGSLVLSTTSVDVSGVADLKPGRYALLTVTDNGIGMPADVVERLFEPFFTTKPRGQGTGLGLATSFGAIRQNDGTIIVTSELGKGSAFHLYLPLQRPELVETRAPPIASGPRGSETVLVVEDDDAVRKLVERSLKSSGYHVITTASGPDALIAARAHAGEIHLLLADVVMPGMNGREVAQALTSLRPHIRVLFMSGYAEDVLAKQGAVDEGTHYLSKPFTTAELAAKVRSVLDHA